MATLGMCFTSCSKDDSPEKSSGNNDVEISPDETPNDDGGNSNGGGTVRPLDYRNITYIFDGVERPFKMVRVEGNNFRPFYIMQTELPPHSNIKFGDRIFINPLDKNGDGVVIKSEFHYFLKSIREATGIDFRLPTTAEWQYAAKGGNKSKGYKYCGSDSIYNVAWYSGNSGKTLHGVALKKPNELGLYDMSGNYAEVTSNNSADIYDIDGNNCGGSWKDNAEKCLPYYWEADPIYGKLSGTNYKNKNAFDGRYITVRLVFTEPDNYM